MPYAAATRVLPCMAAKASLRWKLATISEKKKKKKKKKTKKQFHRVRHRTGPLCWQAMLVVFNWLGTSTEYSHLLVSFVIPLHSALG